MARRRKFCLISASSKNIWAASMLELSGITIRYGPFLAVDGIDLRVDEGEIVGIVGPNGAGKSSLVKAVGGIVKPVAGRIVFRSRDLSDVPVHERISLGISIVPEGRGLFPRIDRKSTRLNSSHLGI